MYSFDKSRSKNSAVFPAWPQAGQLTKGRGFFILKANLAGFIAGKEDVLHVQWIA